MSPRRLSWFAAALMLASPGPAALAQAVPAAAATAQAPLIVELVLNGVATGSLINVEADGSRLVVEAAALREAGIQISSKGQVDVAHLAGFTARYDGPDQRLILDAPASLLPVQRIGGAHDARVKTVADTGALLAYDAYVQHAGGETTASLWSEQRVFGAFGMISNTGVVRAMPTAHGYVRLDTSYRYIDENRLLSATVGDLFSNALAWSSSVRIGGIQIARSFRARPDLVTMPLPRFAGQAAVPTGVDLFVDGYRQSRTDVAPGRFVLDDIPAVNGAGNVTVVTTDAVGRQVATTVPFYVAPDLLRPGLTDFSIEAGALRRGYALTSFGYRHAVASASIRRGLNQRSTFEAHGEASRGLALVGAGAVWSPWVVGALHASAAVSQRRGTTGWQVAAGYAYQSRRFSIGAEHLQRGEGFADLASFDLANWRGSMRSDRVSGSLALERAGSIGVAYVDARGRDGYRARLASISWSAPVGRRLSMFANANYDISRRAISGQFRLLVPFGRGSGSVGVTTQPGRGALTEASFSTATQARMGTGGSADLAVDAQGRFYGQGNVGWRSRVAYAEAGVAMTPSSTSTYGSASGALIMMDHDVFAANAAPNAFAVVDTGTANVPVSYENQYVGTTNGSGRLFVANVAAFHPGRYTIDTLNLPAGALAASIEQKAALRDGMGAVIRLPVRQVRTVMLSLVDTAGKPLAAGGEARLSDGTRFMIGWDGVLALDAGATTIAELAVVRQDGRRCHARVEIPRQLPAFTSIKGVICR
jgi:outer membrane usher protein